MYTIYSDNLIEADWFKSLDKKFSIVGNKVNVIINEAIKPNVIIHPKSIIGFISLKIKDKKAHTVVKTV